MPASGRRTMEKLISQGAEAKLYLKEGKVTKDRFPKSYRIKELDDALRKQRTRREAKILEKLAAIGFPAPRIVDTDENSRIAMEHIPGKLLKDALNNTNCAEYGKEMGRKVAILHNNDIIHGDLTTSNMILHEKKKDLYFIDFGLSFISLKEEDRAVDLHVLKEALESKHHEVWQECFKTAIDEYKKHAKNAHAVMKRYEAVEKRGRYRQKKGS
jgi:Kae1-associated kinase Bud32